MIPAAGTEARPTSIVLVLVLVLVLEIEDESEYENEYEHELWNQPDTRNLTPETNIADPTGIGDPYTSQLYTIINRDTRFTWHPHLAQAAAVAIEVIICSDIFLGGRF